jgi:hypothetical protein
MTYKAAAGSGCYRPNVNKRTVFDDVVDAHEAAPLRSFSINELLDELCNRDGVIDYPHSANIIDIELLMNAARILVVK